NLLEFASAPAELLRLLAVPLLVDAVILFGLGAAAGARARDRVVALYAALALLVWMQGFVLAWDYGALDGSSIDWSGRPWRHLDLVLWLAGMAAALAYAERIR